MPVLTPDTSQAEDYSSPIAPNTYRAKIIACDAGKSKQGNDKIVPKFKVDVDGTQRTRQSHLVIVGEGAMGFDQLLRAVHMDKLADAYRDKAVSPKPPFDTDTLINQELMLVIEEDLYEGKKVDRITGYLRV